MFLNLIAVESDSSFSFVASFVSFSVRFQTFIRVVTYNCCSLTQLCLTLCDAIDCSTPGFRVLHHLLELAQTHVQVGDAIQPSHPLLSLLLPSSIFPSSKVFSNELALCIRWPKYWSFSISASNKYSGLISFRIDWFDLLEFQVTLRSLL